MAHSKRVATAMLLAVPAALLVYLAFDSGGMYPVTTGNATIALLAAAAVAVAVSGQPLAGLSRSGVLVACLLAAFCGWTLLSAAWSDSLARALPSFDRALLYLVAFLLFACLPRSPVRLRWMLVGLLAAGAAVVAVALVTRLLPELWPTTIGPVDGRLNYPLTYWNALGLLSALVIILAVHHAADDRLQPILRVAGAAVIPVAAVAMLLTFSRGAVAVAAVGVVAYCCLARPRGLPGALLAAGPPTAFALVEAGHARLVHAGTPLTPEALSQAHGLALAVGIAALAAALLRVLALPLDSGLAARLPPGRVRVSWPAVALVAAAAATVVVLAGGAGALHRQYERFVDDTHVSGGQTERLLTVGNDGRLPLWKTALDEFDRQPLRGAGAGTFQLSWQASEREGAERVFAYSLYMETLGELGLVGAVLLGAALLTILVGLGLRCGGPDRAAGAACFAVALAWALHAGLDIDWQVPAVTLPAFALAGFGLARERVQPRGDPSSGFLASPWGGCAVALVCVLLAVIPAKVALSEFHLNRSLAALGTGDCREASDAARSALGALAAGPRAHEVLSMCAARAGHGDAAVAEAGRAVAEDPDSGETRFALALALAVAGRDPTAAARAAASLDRRDPDYAEAAAAFASAPPRRWPDTARRQPFLIE